LDRHLAFVLAQSPPEHSFALDAGELLDPAITLFAFRADDSVLGIGAIKRLGPHHAEIKSMHTAEAARGRGVGRAVLTHLLGVARGEGFRRVSLETGATAALAPAPGPCTKARASSHAARSPATSRVKSTCSTRWNSTRSMPPPPALGSSHQRRPASGAGARRSCGAGAWR